MEEDLFCITDFPIEILMRIFSYLDVKDLCYCGQVCKDWKMISNFDSLWSRIAQKKYQNISRYFNCYKPLKYHHSHSN